MKVWVFGSEGFVDEGHDKWAAGVSRFRVSKPVFCIPLKEPLKLLKP